MMVVGLTGGIGSGKTTIAQLFEQKFSIPIYVTDVWAKYILNNDKSVQQQIIEFLGEKSFINGMYNTSYISNIVFADKQKLEQLNRIVHPVVKHHFKRWRQEQSSEYVIIESAILFESKFHLICDVVITVTASLSERIHRVMSRDAVDRESVENRIKNQWTDSQRIENSNYVIENDIICKNLDKVKKIHFDLLKRMDNV